MNYWKKVNIGDYKVYTPKIYYYFVNIYPTQSEKPDYLKTNTFWNPVPLRHINHFFPELIDSVSHLGEIKELAIVNIDNLFGNSGTTLHTDHTFGLNNRVKARLNIPILNTEGSKTCFYDIPTKYKYEVSVGGTKVWSRELENILSPVTSVEVVEPTILRISEPHIVTCISKKIPRITLTISFKDDIVRLLDE